MRERQILQWTLLGLLIVLSLVSAVVTMKASGVVSRSQAEALEATRPARIQLLILSSGCEECEAAITDALAQARRANVTKERTLDLESAPAELLANAERYAIARLPALIVTGETEKARLSGFAEAGGAMTLQPSSPPYTTTTGERVGLVSATILTDAGCDVCPDPSPVLGQLREAVIAISEERRLTDEDAEGKRLIAEKRLERLPALILSSDVNAYEAAASLASQATITPDGSYVITAPFVPFVELSTGKTRGVVRLTFINDSGCEKCYDVKLHENVLSRIGMAIDERRFVDVRSEEGEELVARYNITEVPTIILSEDAALYPLLLSAWSQVGSVEDDGMLIFRRPGVMGPYKNLVREEVIAG